MFGMKKPRWTSFAAVLLACSLLLIGCQKQSAAQEQETGLTQEQLQQTQLLIETADQLYSSAMNGDLERGSALLIQLGDQVTRMSFEGMTTVEGIEALSGAITEAKQAFHAVQGNVTNAQRTAAKVRYASDALTHKHQPLWFQLYRPLQDSINLLDKSALEQNKTLLEEGSSLLKAQYDLIRPSIVISRPAEDVTKMDSLVAFVTNQSISAQDPYRNIRNVILPLKQTVDKLFMKKETTAYTPMIDERQPVKWTLTFASVIIAALAFAGWRLSRKDGITSVPRG